MIVDESNVTFEIKNSQPRGYCFVALKVCKKDLYLFRTQTFSVSHFEPQKALIKHLLRL